MCPVASMARFHGLGSRARLLQNMRRSKATGLAQVACAAEQPINFYLCETSHAGQVRPYDTLHGPAKVKGPHPVRPGRVLLIERRRARREDGIRVLRGITPPKLSQQSRHGQAGLREGNRLHDARIPRGAALAAMEPA